MTPKNVVHSFCFRFHLNVNLPNVLDAEFAFTLTGLALRAFHRPGLGFSDLGLNNDMQSGSCARASKFSALQYLGVSPKIPDGLLKKDSYRQIAIPVS